ncbi:uncharacterized protein K452DRAFT_229337 [Aplosporella prunicola CBS 121167]|uniref:Uncharacterized protein n=1 Tax=Aplosporella prunicola CBS 121167 TaxID=1176127 RepID=A0A6A6BF99_9PEZI|nr:uncharacterized protein K452DRAFT_229337 [Aplosporella prunicola CBS 121167]KAF2141151.1 hypothetical protein K452DRAFT_229337 [Aplosporella prunicola CBS 121167]
MAIPTKRQDEDCILDTVRNNPTRGDVLDAIDQWNTDVNHVNHFLDTFHTLGNSTAIQNAATNVLQFAKDEPCQLATLSNIADFQNGDGPNAFECALEDLGEVFETRVLDNIRNIIMSPSNNVTVQHAVHDINIFRCCNVLPDLDILWRDSASDKNLNQVPVSPARPNACYSYNCSADPLASVCKAERN